MPSQARSRVTVDAIVQAATCILTEDGWDGLTTNAIAERAGVNIGSLYRFFPNKEAVIAEVQRRHAVATHAELLRTLTLLPEQHTLREALTLVIEMIVAEHRVAPAVHKAIAEELPRALRSMTEEKGRLRRRIRASLEPFMTNVPNPDLAVYMMSVAAEAIVHNVAAERADLLDDPALVTELVALFENFVHRSGEGMS